MAVDFTSYARGPGGLREFSDPAAVVAGPWHRLSGVRGARTGFVEIRIDHAAIARITKEIEGIPGAMEKAMPAALNSAASQMRTYMIREFGARMNVIRKKSLHDRVQIRERATRYSWASSVQFSLTRFTVASFRDVQQTPAGVTWSTGGTTNSLRGGFIPRAFIQHGFTHYQTGDYLDLKQVWRRAGPMGMSAKLVPRKPLFVMRGPSLAYVFSDDPGFQGQAEDRGGQILEKKVQQQVNRILKGA